MKLLSWSVHQSKDGYYRLYRRINGIVRGIYLGSEYDEAKARRLIKSKEQALGHGWTKEQIAIDFLQSHEPKPRGYFVGFSGGKDSVVLLDLVRRSGVKYSAFFTAGTLDPPEVKRYIKQYYPEIVWLRPKRSFYESLQTNGYPTKSRRWCCVEMREKPAKHIPLNRRLMGIRSEESYKRASREQISPLPDGFTHYKPIFHWKEWEIWEYINQRELPYCSLYDEGFDRIGCVVCPWICFKNSKLIGQHKERWPGLYRAFEHSMHRYYKRKFPERPDAFRDRSFEDFIQAWYDGFE